MTVNDTVNVTLVNGGDGAVTVIVPESDVAPPMTFKGLAMLTLNWPLPLPDPFATVSHD